MPEFGPSLTPIHFATASRIALKHDPRLSSSSILDATRTWAVEIIFREEKSDPEKITAREAEYKTKFANPFVAGRRGYIDDVILPHETRKRISRSLAMLKDKELTNPARKHGNIPL